jgi:hypothetical protein
MDGLHLLLFGIVFGLIAALLLIGQRPVVFTAPGGGGGGGCGSLLLGIGVFLLMIAFIGQAV